MRAWFALLRTAVLVAMFGAPAMAAPPPPPPPPPSDMPAAVDGFDTEAVWSSYSYWVTSRVGEARALALETAPAPDSLGPEYLRSTDGPRMRAYLAEGGGETYGFDVRLDRWCRYRSPEAPVCTWVARMATSRDGVDQAFVRANFDMERAVRFLRANNTAPEEFSPWPSQSFGLPDPLDVGPMPYVHFGQATEAECEQVGATLAAAQRAREELTISSSRPRSREDSAGRPPPLHAGSMEIIFPHWFVRRPGSDPVSDADLVIRGYGPSILVTSLAQTIFQPLQRCSQMRDVS